MKPPVPKSDLLARGSLVVALQRRAWAKCRGKWGALDEEMFQRGLDHHRAVARAMGQPHAEVYDSGIVIRFGLERSP